MSDKLSLSVDNTSTDIAKKTENLDSTWKEAPRSWGNSLHRLAPYIGGFPPALAHYFMRRFSNPGDIVLDPLCGSGTTPLEAALSDRRGYGNDAFTYAYTLSSAKCNPLSDNSFEHQLDTYVQESEKIDNTGMELLNNKDVEIFFSDYTLDQLLRLREVLRGDDSSTAMYLKSVICGILHGPSEMYLSLQTKDAYSGSPDYVRGYADEHNLECPEVDIKPKALKKHRLATSDEFPTDISDKTRITNDDVRDMCFKDDTVDLIVTSPPYMAKIQYTYNNWLRLWWLGEEVSDERENLDITQDSDRYSSFMREALSEMYRVLSPDSFCVLVVGDVKKHLSSGTKLINTAGMIGEIASEDTAFTYRGIIEDAYNVENRSYVASNEKKYEQPDDGEEFEVIDRCLILSKGDPDIPSGPSIDWSQG